MTTTSSTPVLRSAVLGLGAFAFVAAGFFAFNGGTASGGDTAPTLDLSNLSAADRALLGEEIRGYLLDNPEVIMEAVAVLEERQQASAAEADGALIQANADAIFNDGFSHVSGNPEGDVTLVEFIDYRCGFCRRAHGDVQELVASDGNIRLITKEFPILGPNSQASSEFAIAVKQIAGAEAYKAASEALIQLNAEMTEPALRRLAETLDLDADAVLETMKSVPVQEEIQQTRALAQQLNINGTPTFVLGTEMLRGYMPLEGMREVVAAVREAG